ncbi:MAG: hypothetical protein AVDCRST_MAG72-2671 [uncultured Nocardioidaceae bacterium]|uniref:Cellulose synthase n=1 Tax=uncultured Nocardioidaceae bacterium TaxID=253824 RepID=A0A6J4MPQ7_9ACTN|nr:MAG: hypothetical protein AVDCRST_MAG72-2671 [uncultured Nocardioidaceae bacterium]
MGIDEVTWQVLTVVLTVSGLVASVVLWRLRGLASGLRGLAWSLLPVAALLTGTWRLIWDIGNAVASWGVRFVFSPVVWLGVGVAGASAALFFLTGVLRRRGAAGRSRPAVDGRPEGASAVTTGSAVDDDMAEIEALLKKRGIS